MTASASLHQHHCIITTASSPLHHRDCTIITAPSSLQMNSDEYTVMGIQ
jgi:hypothetical protein